MATNTAGELDRSFGQEGYVWLGGPAMLGEANDVVEGWDKKLYAIIGKHQDGEGYGVAVLENDGRPDDHFGPDGLRLGTFGSDRLNPGATEGERIMRLLDGRILTAGTFIHGTDEQKFETAPAMACYLPNGELDKGFGRDGQTIIRFPESRAGHPKKYALAPGRRLEGIREQPIISGHPTFTVPLNQDRIYLMVNVAEQAAPGKSLIAILCLGLDGQLIAEFGEAGVVIIEHSRLSITGYAIQYHAQHLYIGGSGDTSNSGNPLVMKLDTEGTLDRAFGDDGYKLDERVGGVLLDLQIAAGGSLAPRETETIFGIGNGPVVAQGLAVSYDVTSGAVDLGFNFGNALLWQVNEGGWTIWHACAVSQGRLVIVGDGGAKGSMIVVRVNRDGTLDTGFGNGGWVDSGLEFSTAVGVAVDPDTHAIVVCGMHRKGLEEPDHPFVARFLGV